MEYHPRKWSVNLIECVAEATCSHDGRGSGRPGSETSGNTRVVDLGVLGLSDRQRAILESQEPEEQIAALRPYLAASRDGDAHLVSRELQVSCDLRDDAQAPIGLTRDDVQFLHDSGTTFRLAYKP